MNTQDIFDICLAKKLNGGGGGGNYEAKTLTPDFSNGNVTISPDEGYDALSSVTIKKDSKLIASNIKKDVVVHGIKGTVEPLGDYSFSVKFSGTTFDFYENPITSVEFHEGVLSIPEMSGISTSDLVSVTFPASLTSIGERCFYGCSTIEQVTFKSPTSLKVLPTSCFEGCTNLESIVIPDGVETIEHSCFRYCENLRNITFASTGSLKTIENYAFGDCLWLDDEITIPEGVETIGEGAFAWSETLQTVHLPSTLKTIGDVAFAGAWYMYNIEIPSSVESIGIECFVDCSSLLTITVHKPQDSIEGAPWGAPETTEVIWDG